MKCNHYGSFSCGYGYYGMWACQGDLSWLRDKPESASSTQSVAPESLV